MATDKELSDFLTDVERRAFKQAVYAVRKDEAALDIVQDAMIKLAEKYGDWPIWLQMAIWPVLTVILSLLLMAVMWVAMLPAAAICWLVAAMNVTGRQR